MADLVVIGGGIIGLTIARQLLREHPSTAVVVLEKEPNSTAHASGRNSGVLHAGFYYAPDSLKARLTRRGNEMLHAFCDEAGVAVRRCGKVVVTRNDVEVDRLRALHERGLTNGVPVELIDADRLRELEPQARTQELALWSPTTSVADPAAVVEAMAADFLRSGGRIRYGSVVVSARPGELLVRSGGRERGARAGRDSGRIGGQLERWSVGHIVNCAGLYADQVAGWFGMCDDYRIVPFKGVYRYGNWPPNQLKCHVYPVPDPRNPFLGVHATVTVDGRAKIGPTAIPAMGRENYAWLQGLNTSEVVDAVGGLAGFVRSPEQDAIGLIGSEVPKYSHRRLAHEAAELVPAIRSRDFKEKGRPGIRAQLVNRKTGALEMDFVVRGDSDSTHVLNAVSPAWTSSLAFAEHVVGGMKL
jgi:L-2-hydroxyglutarate oxidase